MYIYINIYLLYYIVYIVKFINVTRLPYFHRLPLSPVLHLEPELLEALGTQPPHAPQRPGADGGLRGRQRRRQQPRLHLGQGLGRGRQRGGRGQRGQGGARSCLL